MTASQSSFIEVLSTGLQVCVSSCITVIYTIRHGAVVIIFPPNKHRSSDSVHLRRAGLTIDRFPFNLLFFRTTLISGHQKGRTVCDFNEARDVEVVAASKDHVQIMCTSLQTDNHTSIASLNFYRPDDLPEAISYLWQE